MLMHARASRERCLFFKVIFTTTPQCSGSHEVPAGVNMGKLEFVFFP